MSKTKKKHLVLLDMHAILHRAYHGLPDFSSSKGEPTGALYGLSLMLLKVMEDLDPDYIAACYDLPGPTHRHEEFKDYKAGRAKTEDALVEQIQRSRDVLDAFCVPYFEVPGFEADDLLGTIVEHVKDEKEIETIIASGDMDTLQLVRGSEVKVYTLKKGIKDTVLYDEKAVRERFGFSPDLLPDYKGLRGDPSDNIPGIPGIGEKTATTLLVSVGGLDEIYSMLKKNEKKLLGMDGISARIAKLLSEHEEDAYFSKMLATIRRDAPLEFVLPEVRWKELCNYDTVQKLFADLEFNSLIERLRKLFGKDAASLQTTFGFDEESVKEEELDRAKIALWLVDSNITNPSLEDILDYTKAKTFAGALEKLEKEIVEKGLETVYNSIELPLIPIIKEMCRRGVKIDLTFLKSLSDTYGDELSSFERKIYDLAGEEFNINSPKQLGEILYDKLGLRGGTRIKRTSTGNRSTQESELQKLKETHDIIPLILEYRELQKLLSTYIDAISSQVGEDGRLHAEFIQTGTTTGRISSQNPNLQNIPIRTERGRVIRNAFISEEGCSLLAFDYSQIELRIAAVLSGDEKLIEIFRQGKDVHAAVASDVFGVPEAEVTKAQRSRAKTINFGILYGMGVVALQKNLETTRGEAEQFHDEYFATYQGLARFIAKTKLDASKRGYTETLFGRRRYFEGIQSKIPYIRAQAERMAINAPIQGTQADIIKLAMVRINEFLQENNYIRDSHLLLQVHDELVYEVRTEMVEELAREIQGIMETIVPLEKSHGIVFKAEGRAGKSWGDMEELNF